MHRLAAIAFDLPEDHFEDKIDRGFSILRVLNYPDQNEQPEEGQLRAGEHSDYDNLTICLIEDKPGGLQARSPEPATGWTCRRLPGRSWSISATS